MKVTIQQKALAELASKAASGADPKGSMPVLANAVLHVESGRFHAASTDLYSSVRTSEPCAVEDAGVPIAVSAKQFKDVVAKMPAGEVKLAVEEHQLRLSSGRSRYRLPTADPDNSPPIPSAPEGGVEVVSEDLSRAIDAAAVAMSQDHTRAHLFGVMVHIEGRVIRAVATDGHRLHAVEVPHKGDEFGPVIVPPNGVALLKSLGKGAVRLGIDKGNLFATLGDTTIAARLPEEQFPPYDKVVPKIAKHTIRVERGALLDATKRILTVAGQVYNIRLTTVAGLVSLDAESVDVGEGHEEVPSDATGDGPVVGMNGRYFIDALTKCEADEVELWINDALDPVSVRADGYTAVVMPMRA